MTNLTAKKLFNTLYRSLDNNGFKEEIATFLISQETNELISDSDIAMNQLFNIAQTPDRSKYALLKLTDAVRSYFNYTAQLSERYKQQLEDLYRFSQEKPNTSLVIHDELTTRQVNIGEILNPSELTPFIAMVNIIREHIESHEDNGLIKTLISI